MVADGDVYKATGRSSLMARFALLKLALLVPALLIGVHHGLVAVGAAHLVTTVIVKGVRAVVSANILDVRLRDLFLPPRSTVVAASALAAAAGGLLPPTSTDLPEIARLLLTTAAGATAYTAVLLRLEWPAIRRLGLLLRPQRAESLDTPEPALPPMGGRL